MTNNDILTFLKNNPPTDAAHFRELLVSLGNNPTLSPNKAEDYESAAAYLYVFALTLGRGQEQQSLSFLQLAGKLMREAIALNSN